MSSAMSAGNRGRRELLFSVFVGHLHEKVTKKDVITLFSACGEVMDCFLIEGSGLNYGFVRYKTKESALRAIKELNAWPLKSQRIKVAAAHESADKLQTDGMPMASPPCLDVPSPSGCVQKQHSSCLDSIINMGRIKDTCLWVNSEFAGTGMIKTNQLVANLEMSGGGQSISANSIEPLGVTKLNATLIAAELRQGELATRNGETVFSDRFLKKYKEISDTVHRLMNAGCSTAPLLSNTPMGNKLVKPSKNVNRDCSVPHRVSESVSQAGPDFEKSAPSKASLSEFYDVRSGNDKNESVTIKPKLSSTESSLNTSSVVTASTSLQMGIPSPEAPFSPDDSQTRIKPSGSLIDLGRHLRQKSRLKTTNQSNYKSVEDVRICGSLQTPTNVASSNTCSFKAKQTSPDLSPETRWSDETGYTEDLDWEVYKPSQGRDTSQMASELFCRFVLSEPDALGVCHSSS